METVNIFGNIHYVGNNDRKTHLFENNLHLHNGVSYKSYLITDEKSALIDTVEYGTEDDYIAKIEC